METPKAKLLEEQKELERQTAGFEKTKLSLENARARMRQLWKSVNEMKVAKEELDEKYNRILS